MTALDLSETLVAEEIVRVRAEGWSGVLALTQGQVAKGVYCVDGEIAFAASTVEEDRLGAGLFRAGKITEGQFRAAMRQSEASGRPLGHTLVDLGHLTAEDLPAAVALQVERIVLSVLRWTSGSLRREPMERPLPADLTLDLNTHRLLLLGMRQFPDAQRLWRSLGPPDRRLRRVSPWPFDYEELTPSPAERAVLALCTRSVSLADLLALPLPRPELVRAVYALLAGGLVDDAPARVAPAPQAPAPPLGPEATSPHPPAEMDPLLTPAPPPPQTPEDAARAARGLLEKGFRRRAIEILQAAADRHPDARGPRRLLAMILAREGGFEPSVEKLFSSLLETEADDVELRHALASYYRRSGMAARAILQLRLVVSTDSGHAGAWRDLGELEAGETGRGRPQR
ncbi:MAG TPA: DUF4388 domain-containing protein [Vicinamibacteria bacterium]|nr:DUF4388 domain-containing protein [Vicinamibacteria bacterium]